MDTIGTIVVLILFIIVVFYYIRLIMYLIVKTCNVEEIDLLGTKPSKLDKCPKCGATPFRPFLRGEVYRHPFKYIFFGKRPCLALICWKCKEIVGWE